MGTTGKICLVFFAFLVSVTVTFALSERDPEIGVCKLKCEEIRGAEQDEKLKCKQQCERYHKEKEGRKSHGGRGDRRGRGGGEYSIVFPMEDDRDIPEMLAECHRSCQGSQGEQERPECFRKCMEKHRREQGKRKGGGDDDDDTHPIKVIKDRKSDRDYPTGRQESNNPYVFESHHFTTKLQTQQGSVAVLQKFTDRSDLFQGIKNYRVAVLQAEPQTFVIPNHWDADALFFVVSGEGTIGLTNPESRQSFNIKIGDIFRVPAGISAYLINKSDNKKLVLANILRSVSVPGELQTFFSAGGENPESSFFNAFSTEVLEAAFDTDRDSLERLFQQQQQGEGIFKKATEEQIRSFSGQDEGRRTWPFGERKGAGPYNIYKKTPSVINDNGILHEVDSDDFPDLREMNVAFSFFNISQGSMAGPFYYTKASTVLVVAAGEGRFEMACPHLSEQFSGRRGFGPTFEKVSSNLRGGTVVVVPAGHPVVIEASGDDNLEVMGFGLNSDENDWFPLAGRDNVMSRWEDQAMELTFGIPAKEVQRVIQKQNKKLFFNGPVRRGRDFA